MANISRNSFDESKAYDKVILQQGAPITDYDWNEMQDIQRVKLQRILIELFGDGAIGEGFRVSKASALGVTVAAGTLYLKGYRAELTANASLSIPNTNGVHKIYLSLFEQEIDSVMDPNIKHPKLLIEPTRRIKIVQNLMVGPSVPADTSTNKYYPLADVTVSSGNITTIVDKRSVKVTFEGEGFTVKGSVNFGTVESDVLNFQGRIKNNSTTFGGKVYIDDHVQIVNDLQVDGKIASAGTIVQTGKLYEVARLTLFGLAGDIQYQSNVSTWEDVSPTLYNLFSTGFAIPATPTGATRKYKLLIAYSDAGLTGDISGQVRLMRTDNALELVNYSLPLVQGTVSSGNRRYAISNEFTDAGASTSHFKVQARIQNTAENYNGSTGEISISLVQLIAYDVY